MKKLCFLVVSAFLLTVAPGYAQTAPCDLPTATTGTVLVNSPMTVEVCSNAKDTNGADVAITGWAFYDGATRTMPIMTADAVVSSTGYRLYRFTTTSPTTAGVHTYTMAAIDSTGEGAKSGPFVLTVTLAQTAPIAPIKLIIR